MKNLKHVLFLSTIVFFLTACSEKSEVDPAQDAEVKKEMITALKMQTLMKETLALAENLEVITSYVEVPPNTTLPMHFHPGEEFAYILEGSGTLILEGKEKKNVHAGEVDMVPFKHNHTFSALEDGAKLLVFRVHEKGQPERVLVE